MHEKGTFIKISLRTTHREHTASCAFLNHPGESYSLIRIRENFARRYDTARSLFPFRFEYKNGTRSTLHLLRARWSRSTERHTDSASM